MITNGEELFLFKNTLYKDPIFQNFIMESKSTSSLRGELENGLLHEKKVIQILKYTGLFKPLNLKQYIAPTSGIAKLLVFSIVKGDEPIDSFKNIIHVHTDSKDFSVEFKYKDISIKYNKSTQQLQYGKKLLAPDKKQDNKVCYRLTETEILFVFPSEVQVDGILKAQEEINCEDFKTINKYSSYDSFVLPKGARVLIEVKQYYPLMKAVKQIERTMRYLELLDRNYFAGCYFILFIHFSKNMENNETIKKILSKCKNFNVLILIIRKEKLLGINIGEFDKDIHTAVRLNSIEKKVDNLQKDVALIKEILLGMKREREIEKEDDEGSNH